MVLEVKVSKRHQRNLARAKQSQRNADFLNQTPFRLMERKFKARFPPPDYSECVDFTNPCLLSDGRVRKIPVNDVLQKTLGADLANVVDEAYILPDVPGLVVFPNAITPKYQKYLVKQCLSQYSLFPNKSNLDAHYEIPPPGLWHYYQKAFYSSDPKHNVSVPLKKKKSQMASQYGSETESDSEGERNDNCQKVYPDENRIAEQATTYLQPAMPDVLIPRTTCQQGDPPKSSVHLRSLTALELMHKMRWVTLGFQYDWTRKLYPLNNPAPFPSDITDFTLAVVRQLNSLPDIDGIHKYPPEQYICQAGVVNFYHEKDALMAHVDRSEECMDAPLVSLSLGLSCVYLIGGETRETSPVPLLLRSGDVIIMTGSSRYGFHGVPRIIEGSMPHFFETPNSEDHPEEWKVFKEFMKEVRINLNIRKVFR